MLAVAPRARAEAVIISEFMALNTTTLADEDGDYADWIELYNAGTTTVDLAGWHLTDDSTALAKWTFPSTNIPADSFLLVFASSKNRAVAGTTLHANFKLSGSGEYLALVEPDGVTIATQFAPAFPPQVADVSYGIPVARTTNTLVGTGVVCRAFVPADDTLGTAWVARTDFVDTNWLAGTTGVGFDNGTHYRSYIGTDVKSNMYNKQWSCYVRVPFDATTNVTQTGRIILGMRYDDGFAAFLNGQLVAITNVATPLQWNAAALVSHEGNIAVEPFDVTAFRDALVDGANMLAIHGLNRLTNGSDFLALPILSVVTGALDPTNAPDFLTTPTPGSLNNQTRVWTAEPVAFSQIHGFFIDPFDVTLTCPTTDAVIRYTVDFSVPTEAGGILYTAPVRIAGSTCLRATALKTNWYPAPVSTRTYLFIEDVMSQSSNQTAKGFPDYWVTYAGVSIKADYAMDQRIVNDVLYRDTIRADMGAVPTLSIVATMDDLFATNAGIYANPMYFNPPWERPAALEYFDPRGDKTGFVANCGVRMQGEIGRGPTQTKKHSMRLLFKSEYGPGKLNYPLLKQTDVREFNTLVLHGGLFDTWTYSASASYLKDIAAHDFMRDMGWLAAAGNFMHLYLNGLYWGLYYAGERPDAPFMASHLGGNDADWDVLQGNIGLHDGELKDGMRDAYEAMMALVPAAATDITDADYQTLKQYLNLEEFVDYMILEMFICNNDWPQKNWYCSCKRGPIAAGPPEVKFQFFVWDSDAAFNYGDKTGAGDAANDDIGPGRIFKRVKHHPEFLKLFGDRIRKHLFHNGALTPARNISRYFGRALEIDRAIVGESARWGDYVTPSYPYTRNQYWASAIRTMTGSYFRVRTDTVIGQFENAGLYPALDAPEFSQHGGGIPSGFQVSMSAPLGTICYTLDGSDPWAYGVGVAPTAVQYTNAVRLTCNTMVRARAKNGNAWSALNEAVFIVSIPPVRMTEFMYHPAPAPQGSPYAADDFEFVELLNVSTSTVLLSTLSLSEGVTFSFSNTVATCPPTQCVLLVKNLAAFAARYNTNGMRIAGAYAGALANEGERLTVADALYGAIHRFTYNPAWYPSTDGGGYSLSAVNPYGSLLNWNYYSGWQPSEAYNGTPGYVLPEPAGGAGVGCLLCLWRRRRARYHHGARRCQAMISRHQYLKKGLHE